MSAVQIEWTVGSNSTDVIDACVGMRITTLDNNKYQTQNRFCRLKWPSFTENRTRKFLLFSYMTDISCAQRLALPAAGGTRLTHETGKIQSHEQSHFSGANPAVRVHAVLGSLWPMPFHKDGLTRDFAFQSDQVCLGYRCSIWKACPIHSDLNYRLANRW